MKPILQPISCSFIAFIFPRYWKQKNDCVNDSSAYVL